MTIKIRALSTQEQRTLAYYENALEIQTPAFLPHECRITAQALARALLDADGWQQARDAYCLALEAHEVLYRASVLRIGRESEILRTGGLYRDAAYAMARTGSLEDAVVTLERVSERHQVILFTMEGRIADWAETQGNTCCLVHTLV